MDFYHLLEIYLTITKQTIIRYRTRLFKNCFQKIAHKAEEVLGNKIADAVTKSNKRR